MTEPLTPTASYDDFLRIDARVGVIREVQPFPRAKKPAYRVRVDFGPEIGERWSSAQITHYTPEQLVGMQVVAVVNFAPKNIAGFQSECLILGVPMDDGSVSVLTPSQPAVLGGRMF
jgi:tRNA-binding protein